MLNWPHFLQTMAEPRQSPFTWDNLEPHLNRQVSCTENSVMSNTINHQMHNSRQMPPSPYGRGAPLSVGDCSEHVDRHCVTTENPSTPVSSAVVVPQPVKLPLKPVLKIFQCKMCEQTFEHKSDMVLHGQQYHKQDPKPYKCSTCSKSFANSSYLSQHTRIHSGIKPYKCEVCARKFTQLSHLQQHLRTHTGDKPYKCQHPGCAKAFSQLSNLQSHSRSHMTDKPYRCNSCYKCFTDEQSLREHIPRHSDTKHFKTHICGVCGKSYTQEIYLSRHMLKHANVPTVAGCIVTSGGRAPVIKDEPGLLDSVHHPLSPSHDQMISKTSAFAPLTQSFAISNAGPVAATGMHNVHHDMPSPPQLSFASTAMLRYSPYEPINLRKMQHETGLRSDRDYLSRESHQIANNLIGLQQIKSFTAQHVGLPQMCPTTTH